MGEISGQMGTGTPEDEQPVVLPSEFRRHAGVPPSEDVARWLRRHYPCGVVVVTTAAAGSYFGVTVSAFSFISLDPLLVLIALGDESQTGEHIRSSRAFGVSMLSNRQRFVADRFAGRAPLMDSRFREVPHFTAETGCPLLSESISWLDCELDTILPGGDHELYLGRALVTGHGSGDESEPLLYFQSEYRRIGS